MRLITTYNTASWDERLSLGSQVNAASGVSVARFNFSGIIETQKPCSPPPRQPLSPSMERSLASCKELRSFPAESATNGEYEN